MKIIKRVQCRIIIIHTTTLKTTDFLVVERCAPLSPGSLPSADCPTIQRNCIYVSVKVLCLIYYKTVKNKECAFCALKVIFLQQWVASKNSFPVLGHQCKILYCTWTRLIPVFDTGKDNANNVVSCKNLRVYFKLSKNIQSESWVCCDMWKINFSLS